jgi:ribonuclease HII
MVRAGGQFPGWGFEDHFGYSTAAHREAIQAQGVCELHRMSFQSTAYQQLAL